MARRQTQNSVSLFPFLAVLICTMGALILILLLTTRRIKDQIASSTQPAGTVSDSGAKTSEVEPEFPLFDNTDNTQSIRTEAVATRQQSSNSADEPTSDEPSLEFNRLPGDSQLAGLEASLEPEPDSSEELQDAISELRVEIDQAAEVLEELHRQRQELETEIRLARTGLEKETEPDDLNHRIAELSRLKATESDLLDQMDERAAESRKLNFELDDARTTTQKAEQLLRARESGLISLRELADDAASSSVTGTDATLLEFSNSTGTVQEPIIVELKEAEYIFRPFGTTIQSAEMEGFPALSSPLVVGILAAHKSIQSRSSMTVPYVLLLVRPTGSLNFYTAQRVLNDANIHFGYELIDSERNVDTGQPDGTIRRAITAAIDRTLKNRERLYGDLLARVNELKQKARSESDRRNMRVLPDGRIVYSGEEEHALPGQFYAGGTAPPTGRRFQQRNRSRRPLGSAFAPEEVARREAGRSLSGPLPGTASGPTQQAGKPDRSTGDRRAQAADAEQTYGPDGRLPVQVGTPSPVKLADMGTRSPGRASERFTQDSIANRLGAGSIGSGRNADGPATHDSELTKANLYPGPGGSAEQLETNSTGLPQPERLEAESDSNVSDAIAGTGNLSKPKGFRIRWGDATTQRQLGADPGAGASAKSMNPGRATWSDSGDSNGATRSPALSSSVSGSQSANAMSSGDGRSASSPDGAVPPASLTIGTPSEQTPHSASAANVPSEIEDMLSVFLRDAASKKAAMTPDPYLVALMTGMPTQPRSDTKRRMPVKVVLRNDMLQVGGLVALDVSQMSDERLVTATLDGLAVAMKSLEGTVSPVPLPIVDFEVDTEGRQRLPVLQSRLQQKDVPTRSVNPVAPKSPGFLDMLKRNAERFDSAVPIRVVPPKQSNEGIAL